MQRYARIVHVFSVVLVVAFAVFGLISYRSVLSVADELRRGDAEREWARGVGDEIDRALATNDPQLREAALERSRRRLNSELTRGAPEGALALESAANRLRTVVLGALALSIFLILLMRRGRRMREELATVEQTARRDTLTRGPNRRAIMERAKEEWSRAHRTQRPLAVLLVDLDHFKQVNDRYGHAAGDLVVQTIAKRLRSVLRLHDAVGRYGGDEFLVVLSDCDFETSRDIAARLCDIGRQPIDLGVTRHAPSVSVGGAVHIGETGSLEALLKRADEALYQVKRQGRNGFEVLEPVALPHESEAEG
ncbi:MAG: GGDEF domain-containing protein [Planctomycetes bacterium]|nr:GGDEF domain-containing protein [Planctomycetota bacterium]